jgi:hypothetical protein
MSDPIVAAVEFLATQLEYARHQPWADEFLTDVEACARIVSSTARGPAPQKYLGPCGAPAQVETTTFADRAAGERTYVDGMQCDGDIYAREGASVGRCRTCGAEVASADRRAWLDAEVRSHAFRAAEIANAYGINVDTIRSWALSRSARYDHSGTVVQAARPATLRSYWRTEAGLTVEWTQPLIDPDLTGDERKAREAEIAEELANRGPRLHYLGDVLDLYAEAAARKEERRAQKARRAANTQVA